MMQLTKVVSAGVSLLSLNLISLAVGALDTSAQSSPVTTFSDVKSSYWAEPFIRGLAARNIVTGYPDGTFVNMVFVQLKYGSHPFSVLVGDFNNDRKLDFAVANNGTDSLQIFLQTC